MARRRPNGSGSITQRKDGRYQAAVYVPQPDGTHARKFAYGKTWAECDGKRAALIDRAERGIPTPTRDMTVGEWLDYWLEVIVKPNLQPTTYDTYSDAVRLYLRPRLGARALLRLDVQTLRRVLLELGRDVTFATARHANRVLSAALTAAVGEDIGLTRNVSKAVQVHAPVKRARSCTPEQALTFLAVARERTVYYPAMLLMLLLGLRPSEVCGLRWQDVDLEARTVWIERQRQGTSQGVIDKDTKTATSRAVLPLPPQLVAPLRWTRMRTAWLEERASAWAPDPEGHVFRTRAGGVLQYAGLLQTFHRIRERAGLPETTPRGLRRSCASLLAHLKVPPHVAKAVLRHSRIATTMDIYTDELPDDVREAVVSLDALLSGRRGQ